MTVLGEYVLPRSAAVWTSALVDVLALLGIEEKSARQALARTAAEGWLTPQRHGRRVQWQLTTPGRRLLSEGASRIYSFGHEGQILADLGLAEQSMSFAATYGSIGRPAAVVRQAWELDAVAARYDDFIARFSGQRPAAGDETLIAQTLLVHEWRRFPFLDPGLPRELLPARWSGIAAARLFHDRHAEWRPWAQQRWAERADGEA